MDELTSRIRNERGEVVATEGIFEPKHDGAYIGSLEVEIKPAGLPEQALADAQAEVEHLRTYIQELEQRLAERD